MGGTHSRCRNHGNEKSLNPVVAVLTVLARLLHEDVEKHVASPYHHLHRSITKSSVVGTSATPFVRRHLLSVVLTL